MFGLDIPLPEFWITYFSLFWLLVGAMTAPDIFATGALATAGYLMGLSTGRCAPRCFGALAASSLADLLDRPLLGPLLRW